MPHQIKSFICLGLLLVSANSYPQPTTSDHGSVDLQIGFINSFQGKSQDIAINGLIGDRYSVSSHTDQNVLLGLGYYIRPIDYFSYGVNAFYLANTTVKGIVIQEKAFSNLNFSYDVTNIPIYFSIKPKLISNENHIIILHFGAGPNIVKTSNVTEDARDGGITQPEHFFTGNTSIAFSTVAGFDVILPHIKFYPNTPLECGWRFFYLGRGEFDKQNGQVKSTLNTGDNYANALLCSATI